jgi:hypothetical protein
MQELEKKPRAAMAASGGELPEIFPPGSFLRAPAYSGVGIA